MASEGERSVSVVLQNIVANIEHIVRAEIRLAKAEAREELGEAGRASKMLAVGALFGMGALGLLLLSCVYLLATRMPPWLAALIMALAVGTLGAALIGTGMKRLRQVHSPVEKKVVPMKVVGSTKESVPWAKTQAK